LSNKKPKEIKGTTLGYHNYTPQRVTKCHNQNWAYYYHIFYNREWHS